MWTPRRAARAAIIATVLFGTDAAARSVRVVHYAYGDVWSTAVRLIRVDGRYRVQDKDKETGYILFSFPGRGTVKKCPASLEFIRLGAENETNVRLQLQIAHQPSYVEVHLLDKLQKKLRDERGPPRRPSRAPPKDKGDKGVKDGSAQPDSTSAPDRHTQAQPTVIK